MNAVILQSVSMVFSYVDDSTGHRFTFQYVNIWMLMYNKELQGKRENNKYCFLYSEH